MDTLELNKKISKLLESVTAEEIIEAVHTVEKLNKRKETEKKNAEARSTLAAAVLHYVSKLYPELEIGAGDVDIVAEYLKNEVEPVMRKAVEIADRGYEKVNEDDVIKAFAKSLF